MLCASSQEAARTMVQRKRKLELDGDYQEENGMALTKRVVNNNMTLTQEERGWASELKAALADRSGMSSRPFLSDFEYVQHVIATKGDKKAAVARIERLELFKIMHGISTCKSSMTVGTMLQVLDKFMDQYPGALLKIDQCPPTASSKHYQNAGYFIAVDMSAILSCRDGNSKDPKSIAEAFHVVNQCLFPHLGAMRVGSTHIADFSNMEMENDEAINRSIASLVNLWNGCGGCHDVYPAPFKEAWLYNTTAKTSAVVTSVCQKVLKQNTLDKIYLGCQMEAGGINSNWSLKDLYLQPTEREAKRSFLREAGRLLHKRCANEASFSL